MPRSPLVLNPLDPSRRLAYVQKFADSLFEDALSAAEWAREAWNWWAGLGERGLRRYSSGDVLEIQSRMRGWDVEHLRDQTQKDVWLYAKHLWGGSPVLLKERRSQLARRTAPDGQDYFVQEVMPPNHPGEDDFRSMLVDEFLRQLEGLSPDVLGVCTECTHPFVRQRARRRMYCSARCRNQATMKRAAAAASQKIAARRRQKRGTK